MTTTANIEQRIQRLERQAAKPSPLIVIALFGLAFKIWMAFDNE